MPHQTFFNLPEEKRKQILDVVMDEFAENDYDNVSISRIVARAGIAKGSFYQYFADKEDLYNYLLNLLVEAKTKFMSLDHPDPQHIGIFAYLRWTVEVGVAFQMTYPQISRIGLRMMNGSPTPRGFAALTRQTSLDFYRRLVQVGKAQGDLDPEVDPDLAAVVFDSVLTGAARHILERMESEGLASLHEGRALFESPRVRDWMNQLLNILEHGLGRHADTSDTTGRAMNG
jgi:AcrR family transcriptional regulator